MTTAPWDERDRYTVVENAGYEREADIRSFPNYWAALDYKDAHYEIDELETLHVQIRLDKADGTQTYDY